ncbi:DUF3667 domain-containing protein [Mucilaginibacter phyllosphaerae]|uniref:DUF3667 domain-containing protein n=1 Tax=Mucilaginibacter phyllosphaerae TaxID=1812349 RepID=A0A4Y8AJS3_9SPHI|nr:DUF3667 domain-containing protein [Mucilaginibacter phyllosphaerae]MBB3967680.1 hypothetical protein [Mucilaginibacter phyllosphaerae]TEW69264.1 DUF3667 domain-containing protein [Mucilaginibacter phyllosphaerae]GGH04033.1 hypothetical protein GCM10007352_06990 [Mucilaginibacter phyllosphaerae]
MQKHHTKPQHPVTKTEHHCPSCNTAFNGRYCFNCGEKAFHESDFTIKKFLAHTLDMFTHLDGKFLRSLKYLFAKPGFLTHENMRGARVKYAKPVQLFLLANVLFFIILHFAPTTDYTPGLGDEHYNHLSDYPLLKKLAPVDTAVVQYIGKVTDEKFEKTHLSPQELEDHFLINSRIYSKSFLLLLVPLFGGIVYLFNVRKFKYFSFSLIFAAHFLAYQLITYSVSSLFIYKFKIPIWRPFTYLFFETPIAPVSQFLFSDPFLFVNMLLWIPYLFIAFRRLFPEEIKAVTLVKTYFIAQIFFFLTFGFYKKLLILLTLWLMH